MLGRLQEVDEAEVVCLVPQEARRTSNELGHAGHGGHAHGGGCCCGGGGHGHVPADADEQRIEPKVAVDVVRDHIPQVRALVAIDPPAAGGQEALRDLGLVRGRPGAVERTTGRQAASTSRRARSVSRIARFVRLANRRDPLCMRALAPASAGTLAVARPAAGEAVRRPTRAKALHVPTHRVHVSSSPIACRRPSWRGRLRREGCHRKDRQVAARDHRAPSRSRRRLSAISPANPPAKTASIGA